MFGEMMGSMLLIIEVQKKVRFTEAVNLEKEQVLVLTV
jgi:hypothetical protein